ncbi:unnamed protein product [Paramecium pentaurelia]|uniref:Protein kinase domain-containing protein n=1 Tax=Paramecium pentaurelia TaxID=43138 RepID=A0A8S1ULH4_9CILI|nr:unnamed protein product [Paramecium pentaurelia]
MKGWYNQYIISQRVQGNDDKVRKIRLFENNEYLKTQEIKDHLEYVFPQSECFSLAQLIESMQCNFIKIYKGQVLIIILEILKHLQQLHQQKMSHGRLNPQNIVIKLKNDKDNKLTIQQKKFTIQRVQFINYRIIDDVKYEINQIQDNYDIINCCISLISTYQKQMCELFNFIITNLKLYQNRVIEISQLVDFFNLYIQECVDQQTQKIQKNQIYPSTIFQQNVQTVQCKEGEEYGMLSKRQRCSTILSKFLETFSGQLVNNKLKYQNNSNEYDIDEQQVEIIDIGNYNQEELQIFYVFEYILKQQMMKIIWKHFGNFFESTKQNIEQIYIEVIKIINQNNQRILNDHFKPILEEYQNSKKINDEINKEIDQNYKFNIQYDEQKAKDHFFLQLKIQAQNYDINNIQSFIDNIKSQVKQSLQEYYDEILEYEIISLNFDLI